MRERSIHCQRIGCRKSTFNDHGYCCDRCKFSASTWIDADRDPLSVDGERVPTSFGASRYATGLDAPAASASLPRTPQVQP